MENIARRTSLPNPGIMKNMKNILPSLLLSFLLLSACNPQQDDKPDIGLPPDIVSFTMDPSGEPNTYVLRNTTPGTFQHNWTFDGRSAEGDPVLVYFPLKGTYDIRLTAFARGGSASAVQTLVVPEDAPYDCATDPVMEFLTACSSKTWKLNPAAGALWVGPADASQTWWANQDSDVDLRFCAFDDEWTFSPDGSMTYDPKGDMWGEDYMGFNFECIQTSQLSASQAAWGGGTHAFTLLPGSPPKLALSGLGAYIGLPKVANGSEVNQPQSGVTYDITGMQSGPAGDLLELSVNFGPGIWRFTLLAQ
jgi:hypothetical protein